MCCPFAVVEKSLLITQKSQAFVQLPDVSSATNLINFYQTRDATIRGARIFFEYSNRSEITTRAGFQDEHSIDQNHSHRSNRPNTRQEHSSDYENMTKNQHSSRSGDSGNGSMGRRGGYAGAPNTILMVTVTKIDYDVTVDVLQQVFESFFWLLFALHLKIDRFSRNLAMYKKWSHFGKTKNLRRWCKWNPSIRHKLRSKR